MHAQHSASGAEVHSLRDSHQEASASSVKASSPAPAVAAVQPADGHKLQPTVPCLAASWCTGSAHVSFAAADDRDHDPAGDKKKETKLGVRTSKKDSFTDW